jgi:hypothetical protein
MRDQKRKQVAANTIAPTDTIPYDQAVTEGQEIVLEIEAAERGQLRLGELVAKLEKKHGDRTLAKFAAEIGVAKCTLDRYQTVYRAWEGKLAPGPISTSYAVLRELATHPDRAELIRKNPIITKREAHELMRKQKHAAEEKQKQEQEQEQEQEEDWFKHSSKWFRDLCTHASEAARAADVAVQCTPEKLHELLQVVEPLMLMNLGRDGRLVANLAEHLEAKLKEEDAVEQAELENVEASAPIERVHSEAIAHVVA